MRLISKNKTRFSDIQVTLSGDVYQLPPVPDMFHGDPGEALHSQLLHYIDLLSVKRQHLASFIQAVRDLAAGDVSAALHLHILFRTFVAKSRCETDVFHHLCYNIIFICMVLHKMIQPCTFDVVEIPSVPIHSYGALSRVCEVSCGIITCNIRFFVYCVCCMFQWFHLSSSMIFVGIPNNQKLSTS